jgi:hypothetical protein
LTLLDRYSNNTRSRPHMHLNVHLPTIVKFGQINIDLLVFNSYLTHYFLIFILHELRHIKRRQ